MAAQGRTKARHTTRALQEWLRASGYNLVVDGVIGPKTRAAAAKDGGDIANLLIVEVDKLQPKLSLPVAKPRDEKLVELVRQECARQGVAFEGAERVIDHESRWDPNARSATGATGLMQLTRWPVAQYNLDAGDPMVYSNDDRSDVAANIRIGVWYLGYCARQMGVSPMSGSAADWALIYGAYNLGPGAMKLLVGGNYTHPDVVNAWRGQSEHLKQGGLTRYTRNAEALFA